MNNLQVGIVDSVSSNRAFGAIITNDGNEILFNSNPLLKNNDVVVFDTIKYHNKFLRANIIYTFKYFLEYSKHMSKSDKENMLKMFDLFINFHYCKNINFYLSDRYLCYIELFELVKYHPIPYNVLFKMHRDLPLNLKKHLEKNINWKDNAKLILEVIDDN